MARIAIDFDGTCVYHRYPLVGESLPRAVETLKELLAEGHQLILYTMRSDDPHSVLAGTEYEDKADFLTDALNWFKDNNIPVDIHTGWHKPTVDLFIDDLALGAPMMLQTFDKPFMDWNRARRLLQLDGFLPMKE